MSKENGAVGGLTSAKEKSDEFDIKVLQQKKHEAEVKRCTIKPDKSQSNCDLPCFSFSRTQQEEDLRENLPLFDTPLFAVGRDTRFRRLCGRIVHARYKHVTRDPLTGKELNTKYGQLQ